MSQFGVQRTFVGKMIEGLKPANSGRSLVYSNLEVDDNDLSF